MNLDILEECLDLAQTLNFTQTAQRFNLTQPALSKHIAQLENEIGIHIFLRDQRRIRLTPAGRQFIEDAKSIFMQYQITMENVKLRKKDLLGTMTVGYIIGASSKLIIEAHPLFTLKYPQIEIDYCTYEIPDALQAVFENKVDVVITGIFGALPVDTFHYRILLEDSVSIVATKDHPLAERKSVCPDDLKGETILFPARSFIPRKQDELLDYLKPDERNIHIESKVQDVNTVSILLSCENCIGLLPNHLSDYYHGLYGDMFVFLPLEDCPVSINVGAVWKKSNEKSFIEEYVDCLQEVLPR